MIYVIKKIGKQGYVVMNKLTKATKGQPLGSQTEAQRIARLLNRELEHQRAREVMQ